MSESCAADRSLGDERPRTRARFGRIGTSFCRCSLTVNNHMRACPPCCPGGLCVVLFHCRWASRVCAHRRIHDVSLHGSTVRRGEQARGNTRRSVVGRRSVALGLVCGNLLGFIYLFIFPLAFISSPFLQQRGSTLGFLYFFPHTSRFFMRSAMFTIVFLLPPFFFHSIPLHHTALSRSEEMEGKKKDIQLVDTL